MDDIETDKLSDLDNIRRTDNIEINLDCLDSIDYTKSQPPEPIEKDESKKSDL